MRFRSWLCAPALKRNLMGKALEVAADIALFDLEDSVPAEAKCAARAALLAHFRERPPVATAVRINSLATYEGLKDLLFLLDHAICPDVLMLPKALLPAECGLAASLLKERGCNAVKVFAIIETVASLWSLRALGGKPSGLDGLIFGAADFAADLGVAPTAADLRFVRQEIVLAARKFGVVAIDSPCFHLQDEVRLAREARNAHRLGFSGKIAIYPTQVATINELFTHSPQMLERARRLVDASEHNPDSAIVRVGDEMIGPPFVKYARHILSS